MAAAASILTRTKSEDETRKQMESSIKDPISAATFLLDSDLKNEDDELSFELLSIIAMQLSQQTRPPKLASEAFKALSYLILDIHQKNFTDSITDNVAKVISTATKRICDELDATTDQLVQAAADSTEAGIQLTTDCNEVISKLRK